MKLHVRIHRQTEKEPQPGTLRAYVIDHRQDAKGEPIEIPGPNLLAGRTFKQIDSAIQRADEVIHKQFKLLDPPEIVYETPEEPKCSTCGTDCAREDTGV